MDVSVMVASWIGPVPYQVLVEIPRAMVRGTVDNHRSDGSRSTRHPGIMAPVGLASSIAGRAIARDSKKLVCATLAI
jgi:hypothetical protein